MRTALLLLGVLAACGGGGSGDDWSKRPVKPISATVDGIAFTIEVPEGMRQRAKADELELDFHVDGYAKTPNLRIRAGGFAESVEKYAETQQAVETWLRKEATPDGYIASHENSSYKGKEDYIVYAYKKVGDKVLTCSARVTPWSKGDKVKDKVPLVEKMCLSIKPTAK